MPNGQRYEEWLKDKEGRREDGGWDRDVVHLISEGRE